MPPTSCFMPNRPGSRKRWPGIGVRLRRPFSRSIPKRFGIGSVMEFRRFEIENRTRVASTCPMEFRTLHGASSAFNLKNAVNHGWTLMDTDTKPLQNERRRSAIRVDPCPSVADDSFVRLSELKLGLAVGQSFLTSTATSITASNNVLGKHQSHGQG